MIGVFSMAAPAVDMGFAMIAVAMVADRPVDDQETGTVSIEFIAAARASGEWYDVGSGRG